MNVFNSFGNENTRDSKNGINFVNKNPSMQFSQPYNHFPGNVLQSGSLENESYRFFGTNIPQQIPSSNPSKYSCFLAYLYNNKSFGFGPILMNVCCPSKTNLGEPFSMDFNFINQDQHFNENSVKITLLREFQAKYESSAPYKSIYNKERYGNFKEFMKQMYENDSLKFQLIQLPFDHFEVSQDTKSSIPKAESFPQIEQGRNEITVNKDEYVEFMKQEIQLLKEQNQLLRLQLDLRAEQTKAQPVKEYILRRPPDATAKSSRDPSATSTVINIYDNESPAKLETTSNSMTDNNDLKENGSLYEILQEYMLENEELRNQNNALNEIRARHSSEMQTVYRQNQNLAEKVKELKKQIEQPTLKNLENMYPVAFTNSKPLRKENSSEKQIQDYPAIFEKSTNIQDRNSYLHQYDYSKQKPDMEIMKKGLPFPSKSVKNNSSPVKPNRNLSKYEKNYNSLNELLKEELGRIDNTIKDHIRQFEYNNTLRNMGMNAIPNKK